MTQMANQTATTELTSEQIAFYQANGYVQVDQVLTLQEVEELRAYMEEAMTQEIKDGNTMHKNRNKTGGGYSRVLNQVVNCWRDHAGVARYAANARFARMAAKLAGVDRIRLFHDHALWKMPQDSKPTPWHQDYPFWPMHESGGLSIWIALDDVDEYNGCMMFVPGSHRSGVFPATPLNGSIDVYHHAQHHEINEVQPVICRMKAGSCTFHNGLTFHYAHSNQTDRPRRAFAVIYTPDGTRYNGKSHLVTDSLDLEDGDVIKSGLCPVLWDAGQ